jgi:GT2 family glycosyltransferase
MLAVIPTYSRPNRALAVAAELARQGMSAASIRIVDHGPTPSVDGAAARALGATILRGDPSVWWSGAVNIGLRAALSRAAEDDAILVINDDTRILPGYVDALRRAAASDPKALVGSVCIDDGGGTVMYADLRLLWLRAAFVSRYKGRPPDAVPAGRALACDVLSGRGVLIPARAFREIGLFDERRLPHYAADFELSWRARRAGYRLVCATDARVATHGERGAGRARGGLVGYALDRRRAGNLAASYRFARLCFSGPYAAWFTCVAGAQACYGYLAERSGWR